MRVRLGLMVADLQPTDEGDAAWTSSPWTASVRVGIHADQVIFAVPQFLTRYRPPPYRETPPAHVSEFEYAVWMVANLFLKDRPADAAFRSPGIMCSTIARRWATSWRPTSAARSWSERIHLLLSLLREEPRAAPHACWSWTGECADVVLTDLEPRSSGHPNAGRAPGRDAWGHAMIRPRPGFVWGERAAAAARPYRGVHFATTDLEWRRAVRGGV